MSELQTPLQSLNQPANLSTPNSSILSRVHVASAITLNLQMVTGHTLMHIFNLLCTLDDFMTKIYCKGQNTKTFPVSSFLHQILKCMAYSVVRVFCVLLTNVVPNMAFLLQGDTTCKIKVV